MQVSVKTLKGLERQIIVSIPAEELENALSLRLKELGKEVKIRGFRPGKVPPSVIAERFGEHARFESAQKLVKETYDDAIKKSKLKPVDSPIMEFVQVEPGKDFKYSLTFEVLDEFEINELQQAPVEKIVSKVTEKDVDTMMEKLREQNKTWETVTRPAADGDKVVIDFTGHVDDKPFEGGSAQNFELVIGSKKMIPGFEKGLIGQDIGKSFDLNLTFPKDYHHEALKGKPTRFEITIHQVFEAKLPDLDEEFVKKFNIEAKDVAALRKDIKENMVRELEKRVNALNREHYFDKILALNHFDIPHILVEKEIENLKHVMYHRIYGHEHHENEKIPDFPSELFVAQAERRVRLGLLLSQYIEKHKLVADKKRLDETIDNLASAYEKPEELKRWYKSSKDNMSEIEGLVIEELVAEKILADATVQEKKMNYDAVMNPSKEDNQ
jgi:trigger factor